MNKTNNKNDFLEDDLEFKKTLMQYFLKTCGDRMSEIYKSIDEGNINNAHRLAHTIKGNAAQLGKPNLQKAATDVESGLKNGKNGVTKEQLKNLENELNAVLIDLKKIEQEAAVNGADDNSLTPNN